MKTVVLSEFILATEDSHIASHGISSGLALQYYGGENGILIHWTPIHHRRLQCEKVKVNVTKQASWTLTKSPLLKFL